MKAVYKQCKRFSYQDKIHLSFVMYFLNMGDLFRENWQYLIKVPFTIEHSDALWTPFLIIQESSCVIWGGRSEDAA